MKLALQRVKDNLANGKTVIPALGFAAKLNRELPPPQAQLDLEGEGGSEDPPDLGRESLAHGRAQGEGG